MTALNQEILAALWFDEYTSTRDAARRALGDPGLAEDIAMQAFAKLGEVLERREVPEPAGLLRTIAHGLITDTIRTRFSRPVEVSLEDRLASADDYGLGVRDAYLAVEQASLPADFDNAVRELPTSERDAFILTELRGLTVRETAAVLGTSKSAVDRLAQSALITIRRELAA